MISFSTEVTSSQISSDNPLYQRTLKAYHLVAEHVQGKTLEIGCGEGYGVPIYKPKTTSLALLDKSKMSLVKLKKVYNDCEVIHTKVPPAKDLESHSFDSIISFQVIEHIKDADLFVREIHRLLKPGGKAFLTTPNREKSVARNPWHYKEFNYDEMEALIKNTFSKYSIMGIEGNQKTSEYYARNKKSVESILRYDVLKLHDILPSSVLKIPYEVFNRLNRKSLMKKNNGLVS
ncbi:MAG: class I SAM-dependent methyltransferase [Bacteroidota bacterium]